MTTKKIKIAPQQYADLIGSGHCVPRDGSGKILDLTLSRVYLFYSEGSEPIAAKVTQTGTTHIVKI